MPDKNTPSQHPRELLRDLYWSFGRTSCEALDEFNAEVAQYQRDIKGHDNSWRPDVVVIRAERVRVLYSHWDFEEEDHVTSIVEITPERGELTAGELLWRVNEASYEALGRVDHHFFEGFSLNEDRSGPDVAVYWTALGS